MTMYKSAATMAAGAILGMTAGTAMADVTPADVWDNWESYLTDFGFTVTAEETASGNDLMLKDIVMTFEAPEDEGAVEMKFPEMALIDNGDGTVAVKLPETLPISVAVQGEEPVSFDMIHTTDALDMTVSGDASEMTYVYGADSIAIAIANMVADNEPVMFEKFDFALQDVSGKAVTTSGDLRQSVQSFTSGPVTYQIAIDDPEGSPAHVNMSGQIESLTMASTAAVPTDMQMSDMAGALNGGFAIDGTYTFGPSSSSFDFVEEGKTTKGTSSSGGGNLAVRMDRGQLRYGGTARDVAFEAEVPDLPFPVALAMNEFEFDLFMPVAKAEQPQDFGLKFVLGELTVSDSIWGILDPSAKLPHDPATLALEVDGKARVMVDLMDPRQVASAEESDKMPAELDSLNIKRLRLSLAGAELTGEGALTFDNSDTETFDGMPKPIGDIGLSLTGGNGLLDKLVATAG
jgi:hypothetical protein